MIKKSDMKAYKLSRSKNHRVFNEIKKHLNSLGIKVPINNPLGIIDQLRDPHSELSRKLSDKKYFDNKEMNNQVFFYLMDEIAKFEKLLTEEDQQFLEKLKEAGGHDEYESCLFRLCQEAIDDQDIEEREAELYLQELDKILSEVNICKNELSFLRTQRIEYSKQLHEAIQEVASLRIEFQNTLIADVSHKLQRLNNVAQEISDPDEKEKVLKDIEASQLALAKLSSANTYDQDSINKALSIYQNICKKLVDKMPDEASRQKLEARIDEGKRDTDDKIRGFEGRFAVLESKLNHLQEKLVELDNKIDVVEDKKQKLEARAHKILDKLEKDHPDAMARAQEKIDGKKSEDNKDDNKNNNDDDNKHQLDF